MFADDILKVLYQPQKVFKQIVQNPKYWGPLLIIIVFAALQTGLYFTQYSKTYYEQTSPAIGQLSYWTDNASLWSTTPAAQVSHNTADIMNTTFYGNSSLQFDATNTTSLSMNINSLNVGVNCGPSGYQDLYLQIKIVQPTTEPSNVTLLLYSGSSSYFQSDLTATFANESSTVWNNYTVAVGNGNWQANGSPSPNWSNITGITLNLAYPETSNFTVRIAGLFFRGLYETPIAFYGVEGFTASIVFSSLFTFIIQWLALSAVFYLIIKALKGPVTWKPLFIAIGFVLATMIVETIILFIGTATLPAQIHYPFEFAYSFQLTYESSAVSMFSAASQMVYNSVVAPQLATLSLISTVVSIAVYVWITLLGAIIVRALTEFNWTKSILVAAASVIVAYIILSLLSAIGLV